MMHAACRAGSTNLRIGSLRSPCATHARRFGRAECEEACRGACVEREAALLFLLRAVALVAVLHKNQTDLFLKKLHLLRSRLRSDKDARG